MKGLLLAGGHGTRLRPLTYTGNKHMLPIANKPMILYGLEQLRNAGIEEIGVVLGPIREGVKELLGDGSKYGVRITYIDQPEPLGLAHAVLLSEGFVGGEPFVTYLGDNLLKQGVKGFVEKYEEEGADCVVGVSPVKDPGRFGVAEMEGGKIVRLAEKPKAPKSNLALVGVYVFDRSMIEVTRKIRPSSRNELEITDAIQGMLAEGKKVEAVNVTGWWKDTGRPEDLLEANQLVLSDLEGRVEGDVSPGARVTGQVSVGKNSKVLAGCRISGPVTIGCNCVLGPGLYVGPFASIGDDCVVRDVEIENSIVMKGCRIEGGDRIIDSLIGGYSTILGSERARPSGHKLVVGERSMMQI
ncbi:MAG: glucose-1-phosphate thymidylyltransferase [Nitrososphaerota archaeon]|nr:glucose-1-phosphate thymidylyltransferase [Nitrososphaerota archaeon]